MIRIMTQLLRNCGVIIGVVRHCVLYSEVDDIFPSLSALFCPRRDAAVLQMVSQVNQLKLFPKA